MNMKRKVSIVLHGVLYIVAGCLHFLLPDQYVQIMPSYLPLHIELVYISGAFEIVLGALFLMDKFRYWAAYGIILLLIAVFPANIEMAMDFYQEEHPYLWLAIVRLPIQILLVSWAYQLRYKQFKDF